MTALKDIFESILARWNGVPDWMRRTVQLGSLAGVAGLVFLIGFQVAYREVGPYDLIAKVDQRVTAPFRSAERPSLESSTYPTTLLSLVSDVGKVPTGLGPRGRVRLYEHGGGMTSFGGEVLLLAYTGDVFAATSGTDIRKTAISAPDNGRDAYLALADDPESGYNFHRGYLRYNDLIFVDGPVRRGLVAAYSEFHGEAACTTNTLAFLPVSADVTDIADVTATGEDWEILLRTEPCLPLKSKQLAVEGQMAGGRLAFQAPSTLYMTSGDYHLDGMRSEGAPIAQTDADYGKLLAVNLETGEMTHVSTGHRNMQGIALGLGGEVYLAEHGPRGGDELNRIVPGANYGWPRVSLGTAYSGAPLPNSGPLGRHDGYEPPIAAWVPSVAVSGMARVEGFHEAWEGDLIVTTLQDRALHRVRLHGDGAQYIERIPVAQRLRQVHQHTDGRLVLWTDNQELVFLTAESLSSTAEQLPAFIASLDASDRVKQGFETAMGRCIECHSLNRGDHTKAPSLASIYGNEIASTSYEGYSDALRSKSGDWDRDSLMAYLSDPQGYAPGTYMPYADSEDPRVIEAIVDYLFHLDNQF